jgi:hypothetical protein
MVAVSKTDASWLATAFTVTWLGVGIVDGAVYSPAVVIMPTEELPPTVPFTLQMQE